MDWQRLARFVKQRRDELGVRQQEVVDRAGRGLSLPVLSQIENAKNDSPRASTLTAIDRGLGWEIGSSVAILGGGDPTNAPPPVAPNEFTTIAHDHSPVGGAHLPPGVSELRARVDRLASQLAALYETQAEAANRISELQATVDALRALHDDEGGPGGESAAR